MSVPADVPGPLTLPAGAQTQLAPEQEPELYASSSRFEAWLERLWRRPAWLAPSALALCGAAAAGYVLTHDPTDGRPDTFGPCAFKALTGYDCPGCGGTRMVWYLLHGDLVQAGRHHLMALFAVPFLLYAFVALVTGRVGGRLARYLPQLQISGPIFGLYFGAWLLFAVLRNLPLEPFSWFYVS